MRLPPTMGNPLPVPEDQFSPPTLPFLKKQKPSKPLIRLVTALRHYAENLSIATLPHGIKTASMYMERGLRSIFLMILGLGSPSWTLEQLEFDLRLRGVN